MVVERSQPQRCRVGRTDIRFDDRATQAANDFKTRSATAEFEVYEGPRGSWRWRAWHAQQQVAVSANGFTTKQNARRAAENVRANAAASRGP